jgi:hypothetical protein
MSEPLAQRQRGRRSEFKTEQITVADKNPFATSPQATEDFSLVLGGPLFQIFRRAYLSGNGLELLRRRIIVITTFSWLPLLLLSVVRGTAWGNLVSLPFIHDIDAHVRFLISLPLIVGAELVVHERMRRIQRLLKIVF